jgi:glycosyltransferase involved in cell wall biosynthesis
MRLLILCARFPEYGHKGDQLRTRQLLELLGPEHELHVLTGGRPSSDGALREVQRLARVTVVHAGAGARAFAALELLARGRPAQVGWMAPRRLRRRAITYAEASDAVVAATVRVVAGPLPAPLILDHIDALSANLRQRARLERNPLLRVGARAEAMLLIRHERLAARWAGAQITVSAADATALPQSPRPVVIPQVVFEKIGMTDLQGAREPGARGIDLILTGNMRYPPNRDAAAWLANEIVPELRRLRPDARVVVAGRHADRLSLDGVEIASDVPDLTELLRRARVAIAPLRAGTGVPNKLLEAAAAGAAIVATPRAAAAAEVAAVTASDAPALAACVAELLADDAARIALATRALEDLASRSPAVVAGRLTEVIAEAVRDAHARGS